ncbi:MAG: type II toxin-antitoxin system prevent-host-death family antitoxin [Deltaproteobacteria bacterium]|nr:type II toxin-antitoxin system prevent-host-death family antitoxin [Deltaproteobacteria bacterium]
MHARIRLSEDILPISEFKAQAAELLRRVAETGRALVITQNGKPAAVLLSPREYDELTERACFVAGIDAGLADAQAGRLVPHAQVVAELRARYHAKRPR